MKKITLATFLFLFIYQNGISQEEPRIIKNVYSSSRSISDTFNIDFERFYEYDFFGNVILETQKKYNPEGDIIQWIGLFYEYDSNQLLKKRSLKNYNPVVDLWITESWIEYNYDAKNCLVESVFIKNIGGLYSKTTYEVNENCKWTFYRTDTRDIDTDTFSISSTYLERTYFSDGMSYEERIFHYDSFGDSIYMGSWNIQIFNEEGNLIEERSPFFFVQYGIYGEILKITEYDVFDNLKFYKIFTRLSDSVDWELNSISEYFNEYDENNFLIGRKMERTAPVGIGSSPMLSHVFKYKNSCVGIQESVEVENLPLGDRIKIEYTYEGIDECVDLEKTELNIHISPNPSNGIFNISSPIFQTGNTEFLVYSIDGKVLLQKTENSRSTHYSIDLTFLQNGIYILQLRNGDHFVKSKIVIAE